MRARNAKRNRTFEYIQRNVTLEEESSQFRKDNQGYYESGYNAIKLKRGREQEWRNIAL